MDDHRFDTLVKTLAAPRTRRALVKALTGAVVAAIAGDRVSSPLVAAASGICDPNLVAKCVRDATGFYQTQQTECRGLLRSDPTDPAHSAQLMFSCLAGAQVEYKRELAQCQYQPCDSTNCEQCVNGSCQSICPAGVSCVGGQCAGCPDDQHKCGSTCCASDQVCCNHICCPSNVTACDPATGACLTCSVQNCANGCCDSQGGCQPGTDVSACGGSGNACAVCGSTDVCQSQTCHTQSCLASGQTCGGDAQCCSGLCASNVCCQPQGAACGGGCCGNLTCDSTTSTCQPSCPSGQRSCNGVCQQCCGDADCGSGQTCQNGNCQTQGNTCASKFASCGPSQDNCICAQDAAGGLQCISGNDGCIVNSTCPPCSTDSDCGTGSAACVQFNNGSFRCVFLCGQ